MQAQYANSGMYRAVWSSVFNSSFSRFHDALVAIQQSKYWNIQNGQTAILVLGTDCNGNTKRDW